MSFLYGMLVLMFFTIPVMVAIAFRQAGKKWLSVRFFMIAIISGGVAATLYTLTGSAPALLHFELEKTIQSLGGMDAIIRAIEKRVAEHPEDAEGRAILDKLRKK